MGYAKQRDIEVKNRARAYSELRGIVREARAQVLKFGAQWCEGMRDDDERVMSVIANLVASLGLALGGVPMPDEDELPF